MGRRSVSKHGGGQWAGTNSKVGAHVVPFTFLAQRIQLVVLVSAFVMVSTVWSVSCLLFFYSRCPPCPAICKSGGTFPPTCPKESAPLGRATSLTSQPNLSSYSHSILRFPPVKLAKGLGSAVSSPTGPGAVFRPPTNSVYFNPGKTWLMAKITAIIS